MPSCEVHQITRLKHDFCMRDDLFIFWEVINEIIWASHNSLRHDSPTSKI